jgi:tetratricopeptide (TPR) repeat protein
VQAAETKFERVPRLLLVMADLRTRQELYSEAAVLYREILQKEPDDPRALNNLAVLQALQRVKLEESLKLVNHALEVAGPLGSMLDSRATVYLAMNNAEKAIEDMNDAIAEQDSPERLFHRAQAYELAGEDGKAKTDLDAALKKGLRKESLQPLEVPAFEKLRESLQ